MNTMTQTNQAVEAALTALSAAAFAHPSASDQIGVQCSAAEKLLRAELARPLEVAQGVVTDAEVDEAVHQVFYVTSTGDRRARLRKVLEQFAATRAPVAAEQGRGEVACQHIFHHFGDQAARRCVNCGAVEAAALTKQPKE